MLNLVFEAFEEMFNYGYTANTFAQNIIMDVPFKNRQVDAALRMLKETLDPNFLTYSTAICNLCKLNDLMNIKDVLQKMLRKGLDEALQLLGLMISLG
ncbi:hypothetical protein U1Q18_032401 [Sarracenia purpurea var. burkii]